MIRVWELPPAATCDRCGCLLAKRLPDGGVYPIMVGAYLDGAGRFVIPCPECQVEVRVAETGSVRSVDAQADSAATPAGAGGNGNGAGHIVTHSQTQRAV